MRRWFLVWSLRRAGCRHERPLLGHWKDGEAWRVRCRLGCVYGRAQYKPRGY